MGISEGQGTDSLNGKAAERLKKLRKRDFSPAAVKRFLAAQDIEVTEESDEFIQDLAVQLSDGQLNTLIDQFKYAGRQTVNYFIIVGISDHEFDRVIDSCRKNMVQNGESDLRTPYLAHDETMNEKLYLSFGYEESSKTRDPVTGLHNEQISTNRCVAIIRPDTDLVEVRGSDDYMPATICRQMAESLGLTKDEQVYPPNFGIEFQKEFGDELVDKYYNLKVRVDDEAGSTVDTIQFRSKTDKNGERKDARDDSRVSKELNERGGEITMGYVELDDSSKFHINREESKLSFRRIEMEQKLNEVTEVINNVLEETGEYPQRKLQGLRNVPE
ncbi:hypothetical protein [Halococcus sediminicola]|uniref:hypothetical protein n=1 Tax=Halococcus sediminicola TaxID=1264579 RepID=UPI0006786112|nr:hypothetical protein [Halococcus sediminicola]